MEPRYNEPLNDDVLGITSYFLYPIRKGVSDLTKTRYSKYNFAGLGPSSYRSSRVLSFSFSFLPHWVQDKIDSNLYMSLRVQNKHFIWKKFAFSSVSRDREHFLPVYDALWQTFVSRHITCDQAVLFLRYFLALSPTKKKKRLIVGYHGDAFCIVLISIARGMDPTISNDASQLLLLLAWFGVREPALLENCLTL